MGKWTRAAQTAAVFLAAAAVSAAAWAAGPEEPWQGAETVEETLAQPAGEEKEGQGGGREGTEAGDAQRSSSPLYDVPLDSGYQEWLAGLCGSRGLDYAVIVAMAEQESGFDPHAVGADGELGMWQVMPGTAAEAEEALGRKLELSDPYDCADCATWLMEKYTQKYGNVIYALFAYSMGETGAQRCLAGSCPRSVYAASVMEKAERYRQQQEADGDG